MLRTKNIPFYIASAGLFILLKFIFTTAGNDNLSFLLKPTDQLFSMLTGSQSVYIPEDGYLHESLNIVIGKSCSGFNFWLLCFCMLNFLVLQFLEGTFHKAIATPGTLFTAYLLTILVNASRIFVSVIVQNQFKRVLPVEYVAVLHEAIGIVINLSFLILIYTLAEKYLIHKFRYEKPA